AGDSGGLRQRRRNRVGDRGQGTAGAVRALELDPRGARVDDGRGEAGARRVEGQVGPALDDVADADPAGVDDQREGVAVDDRARFARGLDVDGLHEEVTHGPVA